MELITCSECGAVTDGYNGAVSRDHLEWHQRMNAFIEKATGIHPICTEGHIWHSDFAGGYYCSSCGTIKGEAE